MSSGSLSGALGGGARDGPTGVHAVLVLVQVKSRIGVCNVVKNKQSFTRFSQMTTLGIAPHHSPGPGGPNLLPKTNTHSYGQRGC